MKEESKISADYLMHLECMVDAKHFAIREALQKAFAAGVTRGKIDGLEMAKGILREPKASHG